MNNDPNNQDTTPLPENPFQQPAPQQPAQPAFQQPVADPWQQPIQDPVVHPVAPVTSAAPQQFGAQSDFSASSGTAPITDPSAPDAPVYPFAAPPLSTNYSTDVPEAPKPKKKGLLIGGIITAALLILFGGGSALAYNVWYQNPDKVVADALVGAMTASTIAATANIDMKTDDYTLKVQLNGRTTTEATGYLGVKLDYKTEGAEFNVDGEGIFGTGGDLYVKVNDLKELVDKFAEQSGGADFTAFEEIITKIDGNWIKISKEDLGEYSTDYEETQKCVTDYTTSLKNDKAQQKAVTDEIITLYKASQFIVVGDSLGSKSVDGVGSLGYTLDFDYAKTKSFIGGLADTAFGKKLKECDESLDFEKLADGMSSETDDTEKSTSTNELWISRFGHEVTEFNVTGKDDDVEATFNFKPVFNKNEAIEIPKEAIPLSELKADAEKAYNNYYAHSASSLSTGDSIDYTALDMSSL